MDKELKAKWVEALRSGKYKQGHGQLLAEDGAMCCLGVLETVCGTDVEIIARFNGDLCINRSRTLNNREDDWELRGIPMGKRNTLADLNDGRSGHMTHSFSQIADWIEANL
jgi:hypothetical protein